VSRFALLAACGLIVAAGGCGGDSDSASKGRRTADLTVTVWPQGPDGPSRRHRVVCPGGPACRGLSAARLRPVRRDAACTQLYGGPAVARVRGTIDGQRVDARLARNNGCEIARWGRNAALLAR
jgi:hypothetical protein